MGLGQQAITLIAHMAGFGTDDQKGAALDSGRFESALNRGFRIAFFEVSDRPPSKASFDLAFVYWAYDYLL